MEDSGSGGANWIGLLLMIEGAISEGEVQILKPWTDIRRLSIVVRDRTTGGEDTAGILQ